jgi:GT2 family glycosyltransferase
MSSLFEDWELGIQLLSAGWRLNWVPEARYFYRRHGAAALESWSERKSALFRARLLRHHRRRIEREIGATKYLRIHVAPILAAGIRRRSRGIARDLLACLREAPWSLTAALWSYYRDRGLERRST